MDTRATEASFIDCPEDMVAHWEAVRRAGDPPIRLQIADGQPEDAPARLAGHALGIIDHTFLDAAALARCTGLRHLVFLGTGASSFIDVDAAARLGIAVHTIKGYGDVAVAEHTLALVLAAARDVARMDREVRGRQWRQRAGTQLRGKTMGILGLGGIGRELAGMAEALGLRVLAWNRSPATRPTAPLDDVLAGSDILCVSLALNAETRMFLDAARLGRTKPGVILVNTARADIVDGAALAALLRSGHVRHAALDVFAPEPPDPSDPLLELENVTLTAHAGFMTPEATETMLRRAVDLVMANVG